LLAVASRQQEKRSPKNCQSSENPQWVGTVAAHKTAIVVSAHSADFVWRAGGAIALYADRGWEITVACLSFGERGESAKLWREPGMTLETVKLNRKQEAMRAAEILGAKVVFFDLGDYPMRVSEGSLYELASLYRKLCPQFILTHSLQDPYNFDHPLASRVAQEARIVAQAHGHDPGTRVLGAPPVFLFEPHQPEQCEFKPQVLLDITSVWPKKYEAFKAMNAQEHLWHYYERVALQRGVQASRNSNQDIKYAEAYQRLFPQVAEELA
jgi:4-oxalomesaconate hydratase